MLHPPTRANRKYCSFCDNSDKPVITQRVHCDKRALLMHDKLQILLHRTLDCYELLKSRDFSKHLYSFPLSQEQISQQFSSLSTTAIYH